jgi:hypothetical protein
LFASQRPFFEDMSVWYKIGQLIEDAMPDHRENMGSWFRVFESCQFAKPFGYLLAMILYWLCQAFRVSPCDDFCIGSFIK